jgi:DNA-binding LacI/PurR family transcriptional regulator
MELIIYVNEKFEDERALFDLDKKKIILKGDYYHDKISEKIEGYLKALKDHNIYDEEVNAEWIDETHEHYVLMEFNE